MNYYERHLGDYARDAGHLNALEHGVYTLLLDRYYITEKPIPIDQVYRICRAKTRWEKGAVDAVVREFFEEVDGRLRHARCESEIELARKRIEASISNGKSGGRPKKLKKTKASETRQDNLGSEIKNLDESQNNLLQSPISIHQTPYKDKEENNACAREESPPVPGLDMDAWNSWVDYRQKIKKPLKPISHQAAQRALAKFGTEQAQVVEQSIAQGWAGLFPLKHPTLNGTHKPDLFERNRAAAAQWAADMMALEEPHAEK